MPVLADDQVVVHGIAERAGDIDDRPRHLDVGTRRRRITTWMIVHQPTRSAIHLIAINFKFLDEGRRRYWGSVIIADS
jgi:hypothetical protein